MQKPILLLIEDEEDDAFFFGRTFEESNTIYSLHHLEGGEAAITFLGQALKNGSLPRVVFLDLKMPVVNGFDVLKWMQTQSFSSKLPVIVLSGSDDEKDKRRARELGATDYLVKPIEVKKLSQLLDGLSLNHPSGAQA